MPNYTKLFNSIVTSTIWTEDDKTRIVWITMLAIADQNGEVHASIPGLARLAGVSITDVEAALHKFLSPDEYSRTADNEGRRIAVIDGGWELLNHAKYRKMASVADQKEANAKRQRRHRDRNASVTHSNATVTVQTDKAEAEAERYIERESATPVDLQKAISYGNQIGMTKEQVETWWNLRTRDGWTIAGSNGITRPVQSWQHDLATAKGWRNGTNGSHSQQKPKPKTAAEYGI